MKKAFLVTYQLADTDDPALIDGFVESVAEAYDGIMEMLATANGFSELQRNSLLNV
jgi:hypothetical protein